MSLASENRYSETGNYHLDRLDLTSIGNICAELNLQRMKIQTFANLYNLYYV